MQNGPVHNGHIGECVAETTAREKEALCEQEDADLQISR